MLLLAVDTSGKQGSIALARGCEGEDCEVIEVVALEGGTFSAQLVPQIAALLSSRGFSKNEIDAFAAGSGPGSFTGLRVGLAAIKALAEVLRKPIAVVSLLEAVARSGKAPGKVLAALDAGRGDIYVGEYQVEAARASMLREVLLTSADFLKCASGSLVVTSDASVANVLLEAGLPVEQIERPRSDAIARIGWGKIARGETVLPEQLEANYIRHTDAQIFSKSAK